LGITGTLLFALKGHKNPAQGNALVVPHNCQLG
jgi:hypothetical protein